MHESIRKALCLLIGLIMGAAAPAQLSGQSLQRLFTTQPVRAELDRLRFQVASGEVIEQEESNEPLFEIPVFEDEEADVIYALGGTMRKSDGSYTVWINDVAFDQASLPANMELLSPYSQGQLLIRDVDSGASFRVKPGQVLNLSAGQLYESYQYQAVLAAAAAEAARIAASETASSLQEADSAAVDSESGPETTRDL